MMKKLIALMLCLMMAAMPMLGLADTDELAEEVREEAHEAADEVAEEAAEGDDDYALYADPNGVYTFAYDNDWSLLSKDTINSMLETAEASGNEQLKAVVENAKAGIEQANMVMLLNSSMKSNISVTGVDAGMNITSDQLAALTEQFKTQLQSSMAGVDVSFVDGTGELLTLPVGEALQLLYSYNLNGVDFTGAMYLVSVGNTLYTFTLTTTNDEAEDSAEDLGIVMGTLTVQ